MFGSWLAEAWYALIALATCECLAFGEGTCSPWMPDAANRTAGLDPRSSFPPEGPLDFAEDNFLDSWKVPCASSWQTWQVVSQFRKRQQQPQVEVGISVSLELRVKGKGRHRVANLDRSSTVHLLRSAGHTRSCRSWCSWYVGLRLPLSGLSASQTPSETRLTGNRRWPLRQKDLGPKSKPGFTTCQQECGRPSAVHVHALPGGYRDEVMAVG